MNKYLNLPLVYILKIQAAKQYLLYTSEGQVNKSAIGLLYAH